MMKPSVRSLSKALGCLLLLGCGSGKGGSPAASGPASIALPPCVLAQRYEGYVRSDPTADPMEALVAASTVTTLCHNARPLVPTKAVDKCEISERMLARARAGKAACGSKITEPKCAYPATSVAEAEASEDAHCP